MLAMPYPRLPIFVKTHTQPHFKKLLSYDSAFSDVENRVCRRTENFGVLKTGRVGNCFSGNRIQTLLLCHLGAVTWTVLPLFFQVFSLSKNFELRREEGCLEAFGTERGTVSLSLCYGARGNQEWVFNKVRHFTLCSLHRDVMRCNKSFMQLCYWTSNRL